MAWHWGQSFSIQKIEYFLWRICYDRLANAPYNVFDWAFMNYGYDYNDKNKEPNLEVRMRNTVTVFNHISTAWAS